LGEVYAVMAGFPVTWSSFWPEFICISPRLDTVARMWYAETHVPGQWIQVSSMNPETWVAAVTQGRSDDDVRVTEYQVAYSLDGVEWEMVDEGRLFPGNNDRNTKVRNNFYKPILARTIRIIPTKWNVGIHMRFDAIFIQQ
jgi:hypothetical protein